MKKKSALTAALIAYQKQAQKSGESDKDLIRDFRLNESELNRLAMLSSFGRIEEFERDK